MSDSPHRWAVVERLPERFDGRRMIRGRERVLGRHKTEQAAKEMLAHRNNIVLNIYVRRLTPAERRP